MTVGAVRAAIGRSVSSENRVMQRIVVALDGSGHAEKALDLAADLATKYDAELVLLNVLSDRRLSEAERQMAETEYLGELINAPDMPVVLRADDPRTVVQQLVRGSSVVAHRVRTALGERLMEGADRRAREHGASKIRTILEDGDPAETIVRVAQQRAADMIVMGSRGLGGAKGLLVGSVSHKVGQLAGCTCVTVK
jgi:nucleotide-binding universal stress UspA family protein